MFNKPGYEFVSLGKHQVDTNDIVYSYKFKLEDGTKYVVNIEVFKEINTCVVKFYLNKHKNSPEKFNVIINKGKAAKVFKTVLEIALTFYSKNRQISFGFIGATRTTRSNNRGPENYNKTGRFDVYRYLTMAVRIGQTKAKATSIISLFEIYEDEKSSIILLANKACDDVDALKARVEKIVNEDYQDIFGQGMDVQFNSLTS